MLKFYFYIKSLFDTRFMKWVENDGDFNVPLFFIFALIPAMAIVYFSGLDAEGEKNVLIGFSFGVAMFYFIFKRYFNYLIFFNFFFWLLFQSFILLFNL